MIRSRGGLVGCSWFVVDAFGLAMVLYLVLWRTTGDRFWPVFALGYVAHLALPAAFVWLPLALIKRRWTSLVIEGICAAAFFWLFGDVFLDRDPGTVPDGATAITVMSYNLGDGLARPGELIPLLRETDADVVALQEVTSEIAAAVTAELSILYPHRVLYPLGVPGKGVLSRFPILRSDLLELNPGRPDLRAVLDLDGTEMTVLVVHPPPPRLGTTGLLGRPDGAEQIVGLLDVIEATVGPLLVLGDLNVTRLHEAYERFEEAGLRDAYRLAGGGFGFTTPTRPATLARRGHVLGEVPLLPLLRIDYVWISTHWQAIEAWVADDAGSDHLPVVARLALQPVGSAFGA